MRRLLLLATCGLGLFGSLAAQASAGTVEGTVTPIKWAQEVEVCAAGVELTAPCAVPKMDGTYSFPGLEGPIKLEFIPTYRSGLLTQYYDHKSSLGEAVIIDVPPIGEPIRGIDGDLVEGGAVTGTVTSLGALVPLSGVEVCAVSVGSSSAKSCEETDAGGAYEVHSLQGGNYRIVFRGRGATAQYEPSSTPSISVTAGATTAGVDATLTKGAQIRGVVRAAAGGARLSGIVVCLFAAGASSAQRCAYSGESGEYSFEGLSDGGYQVGFSLASTETGGTEEDGFATQFYDGVANRAHATMISLSAPDAVEGVDAALSALPTPPPLAPQPFVGVSIVASAPAIGEPNPGRRVACKKGFTKKKVKGAEKCVKKRPAKKHGKPRTHGKREELVAEIRKRRGSYEELSISPAPTAIAAKVSRDK